MRGHRRMILSYGCSDEKIILFFALPGNSIPHLVHLSDRGGLARIATTIRRARAAGPTLICDVGDAVFGAGTWWDLLGAGAMARLRGVAGYDLATVGNHDLEHGVTGLQELLS